MHIITNDYYNVVHTPLTAGWPCWNGMISQCYRHLGCSPLYLKLYNTWKIWSTVPNMLSSNKSDKFPHHFTESTDPQIWRFPDEGQQRAAWKFPRSHSLRTWESSELNRGVNIPSRHPCPRSWCIYPGDVIIWFEKKMLELNSKNSKNKDRFQQYHGQIVVVGSFSKGKTLLLLSWHTRHHVVKDVIVSFFSGLNTRIC